MAGGGGRRAEARRGRRVSATAREAGGRRRDGRRSRLRPIRSGAAAGRRESWGAGLGRAGGGGRGRRGPASPPAAAELAEAASPPIWRRGLMSAEDVAAPGDGGAPERAAGGREEPRPRGRGQGAGTGTRRVARAAVAVGDRYRPLPRRCVESG